jgi:hypothetical protein
MTQKTSSQTSIQSWLQGIPWHMAPLAILLALLPIGSPHLLEKYNMLINGSLSKPLDIFDFFMHGTPILLITLKVIYHLLGSKS